MPRYRVNRSDGWPVVHSGVPQYKLFEEFESTAADAEVGVTQGYLVRVEPPAPSDEQPPIVSDPSPDERPFIKKK